MISKGEPKDTGSAVLMFVRSTTVTRSSLLIRQCSWPCPTSSAHTLNVPRWRRQSVNPPVDAPTSIARAPLTSMLNACNAASSFLPALLTKGSGFATRCTGSSGATRVEAFGAVLVPTRTRPASMARFASARLSTSLRRTSSASSLRRVRARSPPPAAKRFRFGPALAGGWRPDPRRCRVHLLGRPKQGRHVPADHLQRLRGLGVHSYQHYPSLRTNRHDSAEICY